MSDVCYCDEPIDYTKPCPKHSKEAREAAKEKKLAEIAKGCLGIETWHTCRCDDLTHNQAVLPLVDIHQALQLAYNAGRDDALARKES